MTTKSKRNTPFGDSIDSASPKDWDTVAAKLYHPSDAVPAGFEPDEYIIRNGVKVWTKDPDETAQAAREIEQALQSCPVENPDHYNTGAIEAIEAIRASMAADQFFGYLKGNVMKYLWRYDYKEKPVEDLRKADWYLNRLIDALIEDNQ